MSYSVSNAKSDLDGILHGTTSNQVTGIDNLLNRAARQLLLDCDPQETKRISQFANPIFNSVFDYAVPSDLKGNKVIDIRPQTPRYPSEVWLQGYNQAFDLSKWWTLQDGFTINFNTAVKTIRIAAPQLPAPILINGATDATSNGTWSVGGGATSLSTDNVNFISGGGSLEFNLAAASATGYLENSTMAQLDLSTYVNQSSFFFYTYLPDASDVTSIQLRIGSSSANYYSSSVTTNQQGNSFEDGWNLLQFQWSSMTETGTVDDENIDYVRVTWSYNSTLQTAVRLNNITEILGRILEIEYYSKYMFRDVTTGAFQETVTDDSNLINLDTESYNLFLYQAAYLAVQQTQGMDMGADQNYFGKFYQDNLARYKAMYKSEVQKPQSIYYKIPNNNPQRFWNRWNY